MFDVVNAFDGRYVSYRATPRPPAGTVLGTKALDASDRLIYNKTTGYLSYGNDSTGAHTAVLVGKLGAGTNLSAGDLFIV
jgi:hypothetical protein